MKLHHRLGILLVSLTTLLLGMSGYAAADVNFQYGGHNYVLVTTNRSWSDAYQDCNSRAACLATVNDASENAAIAAVLSANGVNHAWIGLHDQWTEGYYQWASGSPSAYRNWGSGEPNDNPPGEDLVEMRSDGTWNDLPTSWSIFAVCEMW